MILYLTVIAGIIEGVVPWLLLFLLIFRERLRFTFLRTILILLVYLACLSLLILSFPIFLGGERAIAIYTDQRLIISVLNSAIAISVCLFLVKNRITVSLFFLLVIKNYLDTLQLNTRLMGVGMSDVYPSAEEAIQLVLTLPLIYLFILRLLYPVAEATSTMEFWKKLWLIPFSFYVIFRLGIAPGYSGAVSTVPALPYVWFLVTFTTYYLVLRMLNETLKYARLKEEMQISQIQAEMHKEQYRKEIHRAKEIEHEISSPLRQLDYLARQKDRTGIRSYIRNHLSRMAQSDSMPLCSNYAADTVLRYYLNLARENHIQTEARVNVPEKVFLSEIELSILLGNLLENAYQACMQQNSVDRFINISLNVTDYRLVLAITNSFDGAIVENENGFASSKRNENGLGTVSVKNIAKKHDGVAHFQYDNHVFSAKVLLFQTAKEESK